MKGVSTETATSLNLKKTAGSKPKTDAKTQASKAIGQKTNGTKSHAGPPAAARPRDWHLIEALPRTSVGKVRRFKLSGTAGNSPA